MALNPCPNHPKYHAVRKPPRTKRHPEGCDGCWRYYRERQQTAEREALRAHVAAIKPDRERILRAASGLKKFDPKKLKVVKDEISDQFEIMYGRTCLHTSTTPDDVDTYIAGLTKGLRFDGSREEDS